MSNSYIDNARRWLDLSEIDHFSYFIKAWIPFNAWFRNAYAHDLLERQIIDLLKTDGNVVRSRVIRMLQETDEDANEFKGYISRLHNRLERHHHALTNRNNRITFTSCYIGLNSINLINETYSAMTYRVERGTSAARVGGNQVLCEILGRGGVPRFQKYQTRYDLADLQADPQFTALSPQQRVQLESRYKRINPRIQLDLLSIENDFIEVGSYKFCNNTEYIFAGLIEIIYSLRCLLFHGEVVPTREINDVYEPAYHILRRFLESII